VYTFGGFKKTIEQMLSEMLLRPATTIVGYGWSKASEASLRKNNPQYTKINKNKLPFF
jgi:hypothetical protein